MGLISNFCIMVYWHNMQVFLVLYCNLLYSIVLYCTVLYCTILYFTVIQLAGAGFEGPIWSGKKLAKLIQFGHKKTI